MNTDPIEEALRDLRKAYSVTANNLNEKAKMGLKSEASDFDLIDEAKKTINQNAEDWLQSLLNEVFSLRELITNIKVEILKRFPDEPQ